jgi:hypothetical protein
MRSLRRCSEFAWLALLALAAQILLSIGHSHDGHAVDRMASLQHRGFVPAAADQPCAPHQGDDKDCLICWTICVTGTAVLGAPPALPVPILSSGTVPLPLTDENLPRDTAAAFKARGPPQAGVA